jgi:hypothetical protein
MLYLGYIDEKWMTSVPIDDTLVERLREL